MGYWKNILPKPLFNYLETFRKNRFGKPQLTYSGEGEDLIIERLVKHISNGTYVDVGCYHPKVGSNTYKLFKRGWKGINIDPNPNTINLFNRFRPNDTNLNLGISKSNQILTYFEFTESAVSTFSEQFYQLRLEQGAEFIGKKEINTTTLESVLDQHLNGQTIDVLDIDTEGTDVEVLMSNNWDKYKPRVILVEDQEENIDNFNDLPTYQYLHPKGYQLVAKTISTAIYLLKSE